MAVITISSEVGTSSEKVASILANKLGYEHVGDRFISQIAQDLNISESEAEMFKKTSQSKILRFVDRYTCSVVQKVVDRSHGCLDDKDYYNTTKKLVENVYDADNVIILGWGGQCILRGKPHTFHVRLIKDKDEKIKTIMESRNIDQGKAKKSIETEERDLREYIRHYFNEDWNDARLYDLVIDMGKTSVDEAAEKIYENVKSIL
jgi:cytidylate kinase